MPGLEIIPDLVGKLGHLADKIKNAQLTHVGGIPDGMVGGDRPRPSVALVVRDEDGNSYLGQTSLRLFLMAADALRARYGDPRADGTSPRIHPFHADIVAIIAKVGDGGPGISPQDAADQIVAKFFTYLGPVQE